MGSLTRKLKRHGCPNAKARAVTMGKIDAGLAERGRELSLHGRRTVLDGMASKQATAMELSRQQAQQADQAELQRTRVLAMMAEPEETRTTSDEPGGIA